MPFKNYMSDAGDKKHRSPGFGYLKIITNHEHGAPTRFSSVHCWYTPTLQHTVVSPGATAKRHRKRFTGCTAYKNFATGRGHTTLHDIPGSTDIVSPCVVLHTTLFTEPLVPCHEQIHDEPSAPMIRYLSECATRVLWNQ
jgi:hypothetical protein